MVDRDPGAVTDGPLVRASLAIAKGRIMVPEEAGWSPARNGAGELLDILDVADAVAPLFDGLYVLDLDGRRKGEPQLDYLQELARDADVWVDTGVQRADEAIDALVTGARRAVLSTAVLADRRELRRAWKMSQELVAEIAVAADGTVVALEESWAGRLPAEVVADIRTIGLDTMILAPRGERIDWNLLAELVRGGPTWVAGPYRAEDSDRLTVAGAAGAVLRLPPERLAELARSGSAESAEGAPSASPSTNSADSGMMRPRTS